MAGCNKNYKTSAALSAHSIRRVRLLTLAGLWKHGNSISSPGPEKLSSICESCGERRPRPEGVGGHRWRAVHNVFPTCTRRRTITPSLLFSVFLVWRIHRPGVAVSHSICLSLLFCSYISRNTSHSHTQIYKHTDKYRGTSLVRISHPIPVASPGLLEHRVWWRLVQYISLKYDTRLTVPVLKVYSLRQALRFFAVSF